uniref:Uncharacterized protein n=1 Tax=Tanacetum cinerariifolium TaxID=118510 RepID=A0A6L2JES9_TANCI|nr:hypothetical protein [Tanacetum cinerariifolium]
MVCSLKNPLSIHMEIFKVIDDVDFDGLLYVQMYDIIGRVVLVSPRCLFFKLVDQPLVCLKSLNTNEDVGLFVKALYENDSIIDLYCEHNGYDTMEMIQNQIAPKDQSIKPPFKCNVDDYAHSTHENLEDLKDIVDFEVEGEENVDITNSITDDPWLNKLAGKGTFIGQTDDPTANLGGRFIHEENDPEDDIVDLKFKAKKNICYPSFDPSTSWDKCKPIIGMKFENPLQLKHMLANYGVANGYELWFMQNDYGKCVAFEGKKPKDKHDHAECTNSDIGDSSSTPDHAECSSKPATKKNGVEDKDNWAWFMPLLQEDLELRYGRGLTVISDGHKMDMEALAEAQRKITVEEADKERIRQIYDAQEISKEFYGGAHFLLRVLVKTASSPIETHKALLKDEEAQDYPMDSPFDLEAFSDSDYAGASLDMKSTTRGCQFLSIRLISWQCEKQTIVSNSTTEAEYVAALVTVKIVNDDIWLQALVDGKMVIVNEASIRHDLRLYDAEGTACLPNVAIFEELARMRFVQVFINNQIGDISHHKGIFVNSSLTKKVFANMKRVRTCFSGIITPLFATMKVQDPEEVGEMPTDAQDTPILSQPSSSQPQRKHKIRRKQRKEIEVPQDEQPNEEHIHTPSHDPLPSGEDRLKLNELMDICTKVSSRVLSLEQTKTNQAVEIEKLKKRVKKLEGKKKKRTHGLKRLEDASKQGRIAEIDDDEDLSLINEDAQDQGMINDQYLFRVDDLDGNEVFVDVTTGENVEQDAAVAKKEVTTIEDIKITNAAAATTPQISKDELTLAQTLIKIKASKPKVKDKGKGIMVEPDKPLKKKDQIALDEEVSRMLEAEMKAKIIEEERIAKEKNEANIEMIEEWDDVQATIDVDRQDCKGKLKENSSIILEDDDDVAIEITPLSSKSPSIVDYKIYREGKKNYFKIIRADRNSQNYLTFIKMFKNFNREDLEFLRSTFKEMFKKTKPVDDMDDLLFQTSKTMFEHHVEVIIWKYQQGVVKVYNWKLFDSCGVYCATTKNIVYYLLVEKMYPFTNNRLHQLWKDVRLQVNYEVEMAYDLFRLIERQINEGYKPE